MEITPLARRITFAMIVLVLVGLGAYLIGPGSHGSGTAAGAGTPRPTTPASTSAGAPDPSASPDGQSAPQPVSSGDPDIYQWLPFTQAGLGAAAARTRQFGNAYGTYSYTETPAAYAATLAPFTSSQLAGQIKAAYAVPGVAAARASGRQVATASTDITSLRAFGPSSLTFTVEITQDISTASGRKNQSMSYAVTLTGSGTSWQVTDIELQNAGNS
jgi:hypothetical protein